MRSNNVFVGINAVLAVLAVTTLMTAARAVAQTETVLFAFAGTNGYAPYGGLILDAAGNLYGPTYSGGAHDEGEIFELTPNGSGGWSEKLLHSFSQNAKDGYAPYGSLIFDAAGNLYGTTYLGGAHGYGTVYELSPRTGGGWLEKLLHSFRGGTDGSYPYCNLVFDSAGNLYGTTNEGGGPDNEGTVFELMPGAGGIWTEKILLRFTGANGQYPLSGLIFDAAGNLYSTAWSGGDSVYGAVFQLTPRAVGVWTEKLLYSFNSISDGSYPAAGLIFDAAGNLYGTTYAGGFNGNGVVFQLTPAASGPWNETVLYAFAGTDGERPEAGLVFDTSGNLYGTTYIGGGYDYGTVFELTPTAGEGWTETILHNFSNVSGRDGLQPLAGVVLDAAGNLYGTTSGGGYYQKGTVFEVTP